MLQLLMDDRRDDNKYMHILMTNDDGFDAPGITALAAVLSSFCRVTVFAPDRERSSCSSSLTLRQFIRVKQKKTDIKGVSVYAADGTTADCCKIALSRVLADDMPDLIISGMNHGFNAGSDSLYSGTVAGAMESVFFGIPGLAVSVQNAHNKDLLCRSCAFTAEVVKKIFMEHRFQGVLTMNIPNIEDVSWNSVKMTRMGLQRYENAVKEVQDPSGHMGYWISGKMSHAGHEGEDVYWIHRKYITITPLTWNMTDDSKREELQGWLQKND